jgi:predicted RNase H-like HicB family nuclease
MKTQRFPITIYQDENGWYVVECPVIPGCMSQGETKEEALQNIQEAIQLCLEVRREKGMPLTIESQEVEVPLYA